MKNKLLEYDYAKKKKNKKIILFYILCALIITFAVLSTYIVAKGANDVKELKLMASNIKAELKETLQYAQDGEYQYALVSLDKVDSSMDKMDKKLKEPYWKLMMKLPFVKDETMGANELISLGKDASAQLIRPSLLFINSNPLSNLKKDDGFNVELINSYIEYFEGSEDTIDSLIEKFNEIKLSDRILGMVDSSGKYTHYKNKLGTYKEQYNEIKSYIPLVKRMLGDGYDKVFLLAAQNSSEIRACGGFPGSFGTIRIKDGVMTVGDFKGVTDVLPFNTPDTAKITSEETKLYDSWLRFPRDAEYCPDFERVAEIWTISYEKMNKESVDGIISLTPQIIQKVLGICGSVTLSDGTVLDGTNATRILQHDLYSKYFTKTNDQNVVNETVDKLFGETAKGAMSLVTSKVDIKNALEYYNIFKDGTNDRTILMWTENEYTQQMIRELGCSGSLKTPKQSSEVGVYYSGCDPCKLGWYLDLDTKIINSQKNPDGSYTYNVKVLLKNTIDKKTISQSSRYVLGNYGGSMRGYVHIYAPLGGDVDAISSNNNLKFKMGEYNGINVSYSLDLVIRPDDPIEITFKVTTANGVTDPLRISSTPTLQNYRE